MDFRQLHYVLAVVEHGSITKAAKSLFIAQPSLSYYIAKVEEEMGVKLFDRTSNPISLTYAGELYVQAARDILWTNTNLKKQFGDISNTTKGRLKIGLPLERTAFMMQYILPPYHEAFPGIDISIFEAGTATLLEALHKGQVDFIIIPQHLSDKSTDYEVIYEEEYLLAAKRGSLDSRYLLAGHTDTVNLAKIGDLPLIMQSGGHAGRETLDLLLKAFHIDPTIVYETTSQMVAYTLAASGKGFAFVPRMTAALINCAEQPDLYSLGDPPITWEVRAIYRKDAYISAAERSFFEIAREAMRPFAINQRHDKPK